jgi:tetratricopeptide (TPR) repeat protein
MKHFVFAMSVALLATVAPAQSPAQNNTAEQLVRAAEQGGLPVLLLLEKGAQVDARDAQGETTLLRAARLHRTASARALLLWGADVEARSADGRTPLMVAACTKPVEDERSAEKTSTVGLLLEWNASLEAKDKNGETALSCEAHAMPEGVAALLTNASAQRVALAKAKEHAKLAKAGDNAPEVRFNLLLKAFGKDQDDDYVRGLLFEAAAKLPKPRLIPPEAKSLHRSATMALGEFSEDPQLDRPIAELRRAVELAPWWAQAYYDLAKALQANGQYEWACKQMEQYLRSLPPIAEMEKARAEYVVMEEQLDSHLQSLK